MKALVLISSPLQLYLSFSIPSQFKIDSLDYIFFKDKKSNRHIQMETIAKMYNINYSYQEGSVSFLKQLKLSLKKIEVKYDYLFIGSFYQGLELIYFPYLKKKSKVYYLDDGNNTIEILNGNFRHLKFYLKRYLLKTRFYFNSLSFDNYFTIYKNIPSKVFNVVHNVLSTQSIVAESNNAIFIVGTNTPVYTCFNGLSNEDFLNKSLEFFGDLKNNVNLPMIFIPHGRDTSGIDKKICEILNIEYRKIDVCLELYFVLNKIHPSMIFGFGSTALFILKSMYPNSNVTNLHMNGKSYKAKVVYKDIISYYKQNQIDTIYL